MSQIPLSCVTGKDGGNLAALGGAGLSPPAPTADGFASLGESEGQAQADKEQAGDLPFCLSRFALNGRSASMRERMLADLYILGRIAILGQFTMIYAPPNAGKTLITIALLIETIKSGTIPGHDILYINADDNYKGLVEKLAIAEAHGFLMLAPGENGYQLTQTESHLMRMVQDGAAYGKVVIFDTCKKFAPIMDKRACSEFAKVIRAFVQAGGSVIMLAHVNKHRDIAGHVIPAGTSDLIDDADCAYTVDSSTQGDDNVLVVFDNKKSRGDVDDRVTYRYTRTAGQTYKDLVTSVQRVGEQELKSATHAKRVSELMTANNEVINVLMDVLSTGVTLKTEVVKAAVERSHFSRERIRKVLSEHCGKSMADGHFWEVFNGEKHSHHYRLLPFYEKLARSADGPADTAYTALDGNEPQISVNEPLGCGGLKCEGDEGSIE
jgi:hypothetical protein